jgi:ubiquinone/menaquinone biosynthesis C-methylase UbiE
MREKLRSAVEAYKRNEQQSWNRFSRRYTQVALPEFRAYGRRLIELANVRRGMWILDVATGPGEPALTVARQVGKNGFVLGIDFSRTMLKVATARAQVAGLRHVQFRHMDAENLKLPTATFDRILCRFGLMLMPNASQALAAMHRVLIPGGRVAVAVWSRQGSVNTLGIVRKVLTAHGAFHPPQGAPDFFRFGKAGVLAQALRRAGFRHVQTERMTCRWVFAGPREFWDSMKQGPSLMRALAPLSRRQQEAIQHEVMRRIARFERRGKLRIPNEAVLAVGEK